MTSNSIPRALWAEQEKAFLSIYSPLEGWGCVVEGSRRRRQCIIGHLILDTDELRRSGKR